MNEFRPQYPSLVREPLVNILRLIRTPSIGPITFFQLLNRFGTCAAALENMGELSLRGGRKKPLVAPAKPLIENEIVGAQALGAQFIVYGHPDYPRLLLAVDDPPPVLCVRGNMALLGMRQMVAMVGARNASANACQFARQLARELASQGLVVASGLARGIDTFVHQGALAGGTVAVIAGGIDNVYPPENAKLYEEIIAQGVLVSEQPLNSLPFAGSFPARNRIISGMSLGTLVVEASPKSGSLITARLALEQGREVMAIPGSPLDPRARGTNQLLKQGATLVESAPDVVSALTPLRQYQFNETPQTHFTPMPSAPEEQVIGSLKRQVLEKLSTTPVLIDELIEQCDTSASAMQAALLELELGGKVARHPGNMVSALATLEQEVA